MLNLKSLFALINVLLGVFSKKTKHFILLNHNGIDVDEYPETDWYLIPFPKQKGIPFNSDNLATVNRHKFLDDKKFKDALFTSENRWKINDSDTVRDISWRLHIMLWAVSLALNEIDLENEIFVECGTGKGYMAAGICNYFDWNGEKPDFYLIDSFISTMPGIDGSQVASGKKLFVYADGDEEVRNYFSAFPKIKILTGIIPHVLRENTTKKRIKFLHIDLNSFNAEYSALENLKSRFLKGTVILFDDYGGFGGEDQALLHEKFANEFGRPLLVLPTGQALLVL